MKMLKSSPMPNMNVERIMLMMLNSIPVEIVVDGAHPLAGEECAIENHHVVATAHLVVNLLFAAVGEAHLRDKHFQPVRGHLPFLHKHSKGTIGFADVNWLKELKALALK